MDSRGYRRGPDPTLKTFCSNVLLTACRPTFSPVKQFGTIWRTARMVSGSAYKLSPLHQCGIQRFFHSSSGFVERSEEHTSELQSRGHLVCRLLLEKKNQTEAYLHLV